MMLLFDDDMESYHPFLHSHLFRQWKKRSTGQSYEHAHLDFDKIVSCYDDANDKLMNSPLSQVTEENPDPATTLLTFLRYQTINVLYFDPPQYDIVTPIICKSHPSLESVQPTQTEKYF